jgi:hypothetical protein
MRRPAFAAVLLASVMCTGCGSSGTQNGSPTHNALHLTSGGETATGNTSSARPSTSAPPQKSAAAVESSGGSAGQSTALPDACSLLTLSNAQRFSAKVDESHPGEGVDQCTYRGPDEEGTTGAQVLLLIRTVTTGEASALLQASKKTTLYEPVAGLGGEAFCFGEHVAQPESAGLAALTVDFLHGSTLFVVSTEIPSSTASCAATVDVAREINALATKR